MVNKLIIGLLLFTGCTVSHYRAGDCVAVHQTHKFGYIVQINEDRSIIVREQDGLIAVLPSEDGLTALPQEWCNDIRED